VTHLFVNGKVFTGRGEDDFADSFRIEDGVFTEVGDGLQPAMAEAVVDLGGGTVLPGLLDVHTHPAMMSLLVGAVECLPPDVTSLPQLLDRLRSHPQLGGGPDVWIEGFGYDESKYPEQRHPAARDLDLVSTTQPVLVHRCDGHSAACNTRALELAGIGRDTPDPHGARFERDADGNPTGVLTEIAASDAVAAARRPLSADQRIADIAALNRHFVERGIVAVGDMLATMIPEPLASFRAATTLGFKPQCALYYGWDEIAEAELQLGDDDRDGRIKVAGVKVFMDGAYSNRTAWVADRYRDAHDHGLRLATDDQARAAVEWARRNRVQAAIHAMGDAAITRVLDLFAEDEPWLTDRPSIRIEHSSLVSADMIDRVVSARMSIALVSHTIFYFAEYDSYAHGLTDDQARIAYPIKSFYDRLPHTALASDNPATAWCDADNVFVSVKAAVTRRAYNGADIGADEAVTVPQAILLYTGRASGVAPLDAVGVVADGYEASFVVLDRDVFTVPHDELDDVRVAETWIAGEQVYSLSREQA
jgi:hypothetical protein